MTLFEICFTLRNSSWIPETKYKLVQAKNEREARDILEGYAFHNYPSMSWFKVKSVKVLEHD